MTITLSNLSRCSGGNHITVTVTTAQGSFPLQFTTEELQDLTISDRSELREAIARRMRSAVLEANATTPAQIRTAVERQFKV
jgi:hypothetical protein